MPRYALSALCALALLLVIASGCGRKLPPLPPGDDDPVVIQSIEYADDQIVQARIKCTFSGGKVSLLGKPKGLCPSCTDDLREIDSAVPDKPGMVTLQDASPAAEYMVYRVMFEKDTVKFMSGAWVVVKK